MSGGSYDYIYCKVREASEYAQDVEISELLYDLADLLHYEEWWQSADTSEDEYLQSLKAFKEKWFKSSKEEQEKKTYKQIKTVLYHISRQEDFDQEANEALKKGWTLSKRTAVQKGDGSGTVLIAELEKEVEIDD